MKYLAKNSFIVIFVLTLIFIFFLDKIIGLDNSLYRGMIAAFFAAILSPRRKKIQTEEGEKTQVTWIFLKEPIILE